MPTIYMRIDGLKPSGIATVETLDGEEGWFAIEDYRFSVTRGVNIEVGNATTSDQGINHVSPINVSRKRDGASPFLQTLLFNPGDEGVTTYIVRTKPKRNGQGKDIVLKLTCLKSRIVNYDHTTISDGESMEYFNLVFTTLTMEDWIENDGGELIKNQTVEFNLSQAKLISKAKL